MSCIISAQSLLMSQTNRKKGFTLIELLVVIAVIGIISSLALGTLAISRKRARDARTFTEIKSAINAFEAYRIDNDDYPRPTSEANGLYCIGDINCKLAGQPVDTRLSTTNYTIPLQNFQGIAQPGTSDGENYGYIYSVPTDPNDPPSILYVRTEDDTVVTVTLEDDEDPAPDPTTVITLTYPGAGAQFQRGGSTYAFVWMAASPQTITTILLRGQDPGNLQDYTILSGSGMLYNGDFLSGLYISSISNAVPVGNYKVVMRGTVKDTATPSEGIGPTFRVIAP
jgi:prepilin-type N-terminal cleavage/methylation domain-containing protein